MVRCLHDSTKRERSRDATNRKCDSAVSFLFFCIFLRKKFQGHDANIVCQAQTCPQVLRKTVTDLFPHRNLENAELSVITISLKPDLKHLRKNKEIETEKLAQTVSKL